MLAPTPLIACSTHNPCALWQCIASVHDPAAPCVYRVLLPHPTPASRPPIFSWTQGRAALLGDSAHAMQPNLGQGGCMAIEDAFELALRLGRSLDAQGGVPERVDVPAILLDYQNTRMMRASTIHGMAGMAAFMASTYKCYLGGWAGRGGRGYLREGPHLFLILARAGLLPLSHCNVRPAAGWAAVLAAQCSSRTQPWSGP